MSGLTVLMPTLNCVSFLPAHIESMLGWLDLADEIIVVDSDSTDGTVDYIKKKLSGFPIRIESHPRGLYQSWNYGISLARGQWLYISTVGDSITRALLTHLQETAPRAKCDVLISCPQFIDSSGKPLDPLQWAITELTRTLAKTQVCVLEGAAILFYAIRHVVSSAVLGSSASNIYRTAHLQARPFPLEYGTAGDAAWSMLHAFETRYGFTPEAGSTFRLHEKSYDIKEYHTDHLSDKLLSLALTMLQTHAEREDVKNLRILETRDLSALSSRLYSELIRLRRTHWPWISYPKIWQTRRESHNARNALGIATARMVPTIQTELAEYYPVRVKS